jgi:hypothetical protein
MFRKMKSASRMSASNNGKTLNRVVMPRPCYAEIRRVIHPGPPIAFIRYTIRRNGNEACPLSPFTHCR